MTKQAPLLLLIRIILLFLHSRKSPITPKARWRTHTYRPTNYTTINISQIGFPTVFHRQSTADCYSKILQAACPLWYPNKCAKAPMTITVDLQQIHSIVLSLSVLTAIFPRVPGSAGVTCWILLELRMMEVVLTTGAIRRAKLQSNCHHQ